jgi:hypothetical protein
VEIVGCYTTFKQLTMEPTHDLHEYYLGMCVL